MSPTPPQTPTLTPIDRPLWKRDDCPSPVEKPPRPDEPEEDGRRCPICAFIVPWTKKEWCRNCGWQPG